MSLSRNGEPYAPVRLSGRLAGLCPPRTRPSQPMEQARRKGQCAQIAPAPPHCGWPRTLAFVQREVLLTPRLSTPSSCHRVARFGALAPRRRSSSQHRLEGRAAGDGSTCRLGLDLGDARSAKLTVGHLLDGDAAPVSSQLHVAAVRGAGETRLPRLSPPPAVAWPMWPSLLGLL